MAIVGRREKNEQVDWRRELLCSYGLKYENERNIADELDWRVKMRMFTQYQRTL